MSWDQAIYVYLAGAVGGFLITVLVIMLIAAVRTWRKKRGARPLYRFPGDANFGFFYRAPPISSYSTEELLRYASQPYDLHIEELCAAHPMHAGISANEQLLKQLREYRAELDRRGVPYPTRPTDLTMAPERPT